ncbi:hypothetical protein FQA39_LY16479 [Lamprigera yunnana]|nr:hypothetical protein FQA39_LY16479 [Lamprigera yunnana]
MNFKEIDLKRRIQRVRDSIRKKFGILKRQCTDVEREFGDTYRAIIEPLTDVSGQTLDFCYVIHYDSHENSWVMGSSSVAIDNKDLLIDGQRYMGTLGLYELIFMKTLNNNMVS